MAEPDIDPPERRALLARVAALLSSKPSSPDPDDDEDKWRRKVRLITWELIQVFLLGSGLWYWFILALKLASLTEGGGP